MYSFPRKRFLFLLLQFTVRKIIVCVAHYSPWGIIYIGDFVRLIGVKNRKS